MHVLNGDLFVGYTCTVQAPIEIYTNSLRYPFKIRYEIWLAIEIVPTYYIRHYLIIQKQFYMYLPLKNTNIMC